MTKNLSNKVLIVVDMQKDFVDPDGALSIPHDTSKLINNITRFIGNFPGRIFYTLDTHTQDSCEFNNFPPHCISGTPGWALTEKIAKAISRREAYAQEPIKRLPKASYSNNQIIEYLADMHSHSEFFIVGVCTHVCVHDIVANLVNEFKNIHNTVPRITIPRDMVDDFDLEMQEFALKRMKNLYGIDVLTDIPEIKAA